MPSQPPRASRHLQAWSTFIRNHARSVPALEYDGTSNDRMDRATVPAAHSWGQLHRFIIHDRDSIYSEGVDHTLAAMGLTVLRTPVRAPQANAFCERLVGTIRRECLDFVIPLNERHLRHILQRWVTHYNRGRPHASLGPGIPDPSEHFVDQLRDRRVPNGYRVIATPILGGLHHEYRLELAA